MNDARKSRSDDAYSHKMKTKVRGATNANGNMDVKAMDNDDLTDRMDRIEADLSKRLDDFMKFQRQSLAQSLAPRQASSNAPVPSRPVNANRLNEANAAENRDNRMSAHTAPSSRQQQGRSISPAVCWKSGQPGHVKRNCQSPASRPVTELRGAVSRGSRGLDRANVYLRMQLAGKVLPVLVDSGCEVTLMPMADVDAAGNIEVLRVVSDCGQLTDRSYVSSV